MNISEKQDLNKVYIKCYYRKFEVLNHIKCNDFWVILNQRVLDLSSLLRSMHELPCKNLSGLEQIIMFGGTDISKLFRRRLENGLEMFDLKSKSEYGMQRDLFWWEDPIYIIGGITAQERHICVRNKTKGTQCHVTVCEEESIYAIRNKFFALYPENNIENIVWRKTESTCCPKGHLYLDKTLAENGLPWNARNEVTFLWMFLKGELNTCPSFM